MKEIYKLINKDKLDSVLKPIDKAHGLPNECYTNKDYTLIERKKIFEDKWTVIGVASSVPNPGDVKPFDLLGLFKTMMQEYFGLSDGKYPTILDI